MVEQDKAPSYEAGLPQKPANLDAKVPMQLVRKPCPKAEEGAPANGGYYFNVAQKGKLILPTALWVLLIIAGVSFLTLLASLNKTISTLDTLVELEQEKEARALVSEHLHHRQLDRQFKEASHSRGELKGGELKKAPEAAGLHRAPQPQDDWFVPTFEPTWFSMPSWTSLERVSAPAAAAAGQQQQQQQHRPADSPKPSPSPMGMVDELLHGMPPPDMILIQEGAQPQEPAGLFGALMRQVGPLLEQLTRGPKPEAAGLLDVEGDADDLPAMISAKIDNLNVHINSAPEGKKAEPSREEEISSLEKSIDDLVGKLTGQRMPPAPSRKGLVDLQLESPLAEAQHKRPPAVGPFSPLASLLLGPAARQPGGRNPASMFLQSFELDEPARNNARPGQPPMGDAQVIISISDESPGAGGKPSRETNRHQVSNTRRPSLGSSSPYEFAPLDGGLFPSPSEMMFMKLRDDGSSNNKQRLDHHAIKAGDKPADVEWDALASDLAQALVEDILGTPRERKDKKLEGEPQFLIIDQPTVLPQMTRLDNLIVPAELVNADGSSKQLAGQKGNLGAPADLLSLVFGAPSKAAAEGPKREQDDRATNEKSTAMEAASGKPTAAGKEANKAPGPQQVVAEPKLVQALSSGEPKMSPAAKASVDSIISQLPGLSPVADEEKLARGKADELLGDFVGTMFALPQMGGERQQTSTAGARPAGNSTKESMVCECHKLPSNSSASGGGGASSSSSSGGGGSNVGRSPGPASGSSGGGSGGESGRSSSSSVSRPSGGGDGGSSHSSSSSGGGGSSSSSSKSGENLSSSSGSGARSGGGGDSRDGRGGSGDSSGSSSSGRRESSGSSSSASRNEPQPLGYVPVRALPNETPSAFASSALVTSGRPPAGQFVVAAQTRSRPADAPVAAGRPASSPVANARPGSLLSALNNSTNQLLPRLVSRLNNTDAPKFKNNATTTVPATAPTSTSTTTTEPSTEAATTTTTTTTTTTATSATSSATAPTSKPTEPTTGSRPPWIVTSVVPKEAPEKGESKINSVFNKVLGFFKGAESTKKPDDKASLASSSPTTLAPEVSSRLTTSISNAPTVEIIEERESPAELPVIDLSPFAKSTKPIIDGDAEKLSKPVETATDASLTKSAPTVESLTATPAPKPASSTQGTTEPTVASSSAGPPIGSSVATGAPAEKSFLQKADDFIGRNIKSLKKLIQPGSGENKS